MRFIFSFFLSISITVGIFLFLQNRLKTDPKTTTIKQPIDIDTRYKKQEQVKLKKDIILPSTPKLIKQEQKIQKEFLKPKLKIKHISPSGVKLDRLDFTPKLNDIKLKEPKKIDTPILKPPPKVIQKTKIDILKNSPLKELKISFKTKPIYPRRAKMLKKEGYVKVEIIIDKDGYVVDAKIIESNPKGYFENSALHTIKQWRYIPQFKDTKLVNNIYIQKIEFKLK